MISIARQEPVRTRGRRLLPTCLGIITARRHCLLLCEPSLQPNIPDSILDHHSHLVIQPCSSGNPDCLSNAEFMFSPSRYRVPPAHCDASNMGSRGFNSTLSRRRRRMERVRLADGTCSPIPHNTLISKPRHHQTQKEKGNPFVRFSSSFTTRDQPSLSASPGEGGGMMDASPLTSKKSPLGTTQTQVRLHAPPSKAATATTTPHNASRGFQADV